VGEENRTLAVNCTRTFLQMYYYLKLIKLLYILVRLAYVSLG